MTENLKNRFKLTEEGCAEAVKWLKDLDLLDILEKEQSVDGYTTVAVANELYNKLHKESKLSDPIIHRYISIPKQVQAFRFQTTDYLGPLQIENLDPWFMFSNHSFHRVTNRIPEDLIIEIRECFDQDSSGTLFVKLNKQSINELDLKVNYKVNGYVMTDQEIQDWVTKYLEYPTRYYISRLIEGKEVREYVNIGDWVITHQNGGIEIMTDNDFNTQYREYKGRA